MNAPRAPIGLGLMCKPPRPGTSKTRLAAGVGADAAARLSAAFLSDCAQTALDAARRSPLELMAFYRPADAASEIGDILGPGWPLAFAESGSLGTTMHDILDGLLATCSAGAMIMGSDVPLIGADVIDEAARRLRESDQRTVVLAPSADGGYCLIGVKSAAATAVLFEDMAWSTPHVLAETRRRAHAAGLVVELLAMQRDIDEVQDLQWLRDTIMKRPEAAPATRRVLSSLVLP